MGSSSILSDKLYSHLWNILTLPLWCTVVIKTFTLAGGWRIPRQTFPMRTHPRARFWAKGVPCGPVRWSSMWWASGRSRPTNSRTCAFGFSRGISTPLGCEWNLTISGVRISLFSSGICSHSVTSGSSNLQEPLFDSGTSPEAYLPLRWKVPAHDFSEYVVTEDIGISKASNNSVLARVWVLWSSISAYTLNGFSGWFTGYTLTSIVLEQDLPVKFLPHSSLQHELRFVLDSSPSWCDLGVESDLFESSPPWYDLRKIPSLLVDMSLTCRAAGWFLIQQN